jgi:hypothetical protein
VDRQDEIVARVLDSETRADKAGDELDQVVTEVEELMMGRVEVDAAMAALAGHRPLPAPRQRTSEDEEGIDQ